MSENRESELLSFSPRMKPNIPGKLHLGRTIIISFSFFTVLLAWTYFNFKVPLLLDDLLPNIPAKDILKGAIMALDNFIAVLLQPVFGSMSDRTKSKFGRRIPYITVGTLFSALFFVAIPLMQTLIGLVLIIFFFDLFMSTFRSVAIALLPDYTDPNKTSVASSIQQFVANIGGVIAFFLPTIIAGFGFTGILQNAFGFFLISAIMIIFLLFLLLYIRETPTGKKLFELGDTPIDMDPIDFTLKSQDLNNNKGKPDHIYGQIGTIFRNDKSMVAMLGCIFFLYLGFASIEAFFSSFAIDYVGFTEGQAGILGIAYSGPMILSAPFHGLFGQKVGKRLALKICLIVQIIGVLVISVVLIPLSYQRGDENVIFILFLANFAFISIAWMGVIIQSFPVIWSLTPEGKIGSYMGIYYFFNQIAYMLSPILIGGVLSLFHLLEARRYISMFPFVLGCLITGFIFFLFVKEEKQSLSDDKLRDLEEQYRQDLD